MDFAIPQDLEDDYAELVAFIEAEIKPLERENMQYFDRRREFARTDLDNLTFRDPTALYGSTISVARHRRGHSSKASKAPTPADGNVEIIVSGCT